MQVNPTIESTVHQPTASIPVGVVIPMYNAAETIASTLDSVLGQTHSMLSVVIVDDGSTDHGTEIVESYVRRDRRVRLLRRTNGGVAAARNAGVAAMDSSCEYLAFLDADDLWAPEKIAAQLDALVAGGYRVGLAYSWFAQIDEQSRVISLNHRPDIHGQVLRELCRWNFVGNGSSALVRRRLFDTVGGFDPSLRERGAQGCEDLQFYLAVAEHAEFCVVPRHLIGYRVTHHNMSSRSLTMYSSAELVLASYWARFPRFRSELREQKLAIADWLASRSAEAGRYGWALKLYAKVFLLHPKASFRGFYRLARSGVRNRANRRARPDWEIDAEPVPSPEYLAQSW